MSDYIVNKLNEIVDYLGSFLLSFLQFAAGLALFFFIIWVTTWIGGKARRWFMGRARARWKEDPNAAALVDNVLRLGIFAAGLMLALGIVGASTDSLVTWIGVIVAALSLALQDIIKNLVAGFYLLLEQPFKTGDRLIVGDQDGYVENVALRVTGLRNAKRQLVLVPNYIVFSQVVTNRTALESHCMVLTVADIEGEANEITVQVEQAAKTALEANAKAPIAELKAIKLTGTTVSVRVWLTSILVQRDPVILAIHNRFPKAVITVEEG